jgi:Ca2+-binding RTX toxin-like protein
MARVLKLSVEEGEFGLEAVADPANPLVGAWRVQDDEGNTAVVWFLPDGTFISAEDGPADDPTGQDGIEAGTWQWNPGTHAFTANLTVDTTGEWGLSHAGTGLMLMVTGNTMSLAIPGDDTYVFTLVTGAAAVVGGWYTHDGGEAGGTVAFAFTADGEYWMAQDGSSILDPSGMDGMERGLYAWNASTFAFSHVTQRDTNGEWGFSHGGPAVMVTGVDGTEGDDALLGTFHPEVLQGLGGNDTLDGLGGNDTLYGGAGIDMAVFTGNLSESTIVAGPTPGTFSITGPDGTDLLSGIELLEFEDGVFVLTDGTEGDDTLDGTAGPDIIRGRGGNDNLRGGGGDDGLYGEEGDDSLEGGSGNDVLDGGTGNDTMRGGDGNDTYIVDSAADHVLEPDTVAARPPGSPAPQAPIGGGIDKVIASIGYSLGNAIEQLQLTGSGAIPGTGNALPNTLTGNESANVLTGGGGDDTIDGAGGIDTSSYSGMRAQYAVANGQVDGRATGEGVDTLVAVERLSFSDINLAIDLQGNAGSVAKILASVFGHAAVGNETYAGIGLGLMDGGMSYQSLMGLALTVAGATTNAAVVNLLYTNVIGVPPDAGTRDFFVGLIEGGAHTQASLGVLAADYMGLPAAAANGLEYL